MTLRQRIFRLVRQIGGLRLGITLALLLAALLFARLSWSLPFSADAEAIAYDLRGALTAPAVAQDPRMVGVVYDEETVTLTGRRQPVDRAILAKALRRIDQLGARAIGIDILIVQPLPDDAQLIAAFRAMRTPTYLAYASTSANPDQITFEQQGFLDAFLRQLAPGNVRPASIRLEGERDGVLRRWPTRATGLPAALPNAMERPGVFAGYAGSIGFRRAADDSRPLLATLPIQSFADDAMFAIPEARALLASQVAGKYVLIGGHIEDLDLFETPATRVTGRQMWGLDAFAEMLAQQLERRDFVAIPAWIVWLTALVAVAAGALTALGGLPPLASAAVLILQLLAITALPFELQRRMVDTYGLPVVGWTVGWVLAFLAVGSAARAIGSEQRRFAQSALGKYLPRDIAAEILRDPDSLSLKGEKRHIYVVFTDLEGFTKLSHAIEPETVATLLNRYLETLSDIVLDHGGTIDKFVGDAVVAFWGAPIARPDDATRAADAAIAMHAAGEAFRHSVPDDVPPIGRTRVGLHYGEAIVGNFGGEGRIQYTALGDSMNTAARLEAANKQLGTAVLVSRIAAERVGIDRFRALGRVRLRGRATAIDIAEPGSPALNTDIDHAQDGDAAARDRIEALAALNPGDAALGNLVYRLHRCGEEGCYVLD